MTALTEALERLEARLRAEGALVVGHARPGIGVRRLEQVVGPLGQVPSDALREWFSWHDGAGETGRTPSLEVELAPGCELLNAELLARECQQTREVAQDLGADPEVPWGSEQLWRSTWFPVLRLFGKGLVALDLERDTVHAVWWDAPPEERQRVRWPTLSAFVEEIEARYASGACTVGEDGTVQGETLEFP